MEKSFPLKVIFTIDLWFAACLITAIIADMALDFTWFKSYSNTILIGFLIANVCVLIGIFVYYIISNKQNKRNSKTEKSINKLSK